MFVARNIGFLILFFIGKSSKLTILGKENIDSVKKKGESVLYSFWHNRFLYFTYMYRNKGFCVPTSMHRDGEYIAQIMLRFGLTPLKGSTTRGAVKVLVELINKLKAGFDSGITPDGPRGPKYVLQEGVLIAALKSKAAIIPITYNAKYRSILKTWDNFILPYPFNHFVVIYGKPVYINSNSQLNQKKKELTFEMNRITLMADNYFK